MAILSNNASVGLLGAGVDSGYQIAKSLRFNPGDNAHFTRTPSDAGDRKTFTFSFWIKPCDVSANTNYIYTAGSGAPGGFNNLGIGFNLYNQLFVEEYGSSGSDYYIETTTAYYRDPSAWYHFVIKFDVTQGTATNRVKFYCNEVEQTKLTTSYPFTTNTAINSTTLQTIGSDNLGDLDAYLAEFYLIDGEALDPSSFGETDATTGQWIPKKYAGDYNVSETLSLRNTVNDEALDVVVNRVVDKCWIKSDGNWIGGGNPSNTSSEPTFHLLNGAAAANLYWHTTAYEGAHTITIGSSSESGTQPAWASSSGSFSTTSTVASGTFSSSYGHARTGALADDTVYAFTFTIDASANTCNHTGWFINDDTAYVQGVPDEQTGDSGSTSLNNVGCRWYAGTTDFSDGGYWEWIACRGAFQAIQTIPVVTNSHSYPVLGGSGINSCYLKFDGTDLGEDSSGQNHDWTANNLTASQLATVSAATGGLPIHNTSGDFGGTKESGYRTDSSAGTTDGTGLVLAIPGDTTTDVHASINTGSSTKTLSTSGTVSTSTATSKFYGTSIDMTSTTEADHWTTAASSDFAFGTGSFTIEWWQYWNNAAGYQSIFDVGYLDPGALLIQSKHNYAEYWVYLDEDAQMKESTSANLQEWTHYALVKNGNTLTLYRNGAVSAPTYTTTNSVGFSDHDFHIGADEHDYFFRGYIQDFRVYKGVAKYTSAFSVVNTETTEIDVLTDSPTDFDDGGNGTGNYATWNPLQAGGVFSEGNLQFYGNTAWNITHATIGGLTTGKWYYEMTVLNNPVNQVAGSLYAVVGWTSNPNSTAAYDSTDWLGFEDTGWYRNFGAQTNSSTTMTTGGVLGIAVDLDANTFDIRYNNVSKVSGTIGGTAGRPMYPFHMSYNGSYGKMIANFGARAFAYDDLLSETNGYKALNTYNLPDPTIKDPSKHFDVKTYPGTDSAQSITTDFSPDLVWIKRRNVAGNYHHLFDTVRTKAKVLYLPDAFAEDPYTNFDSFNSDGFTISGTANGTNADEQTYVSWNWDAGTANTVDSSIDIGDTWSDDVTVSSGGFASGFEATKAFDGSLTTRTATNTGGETITWTPVGGKSYSSKVEMYNASTAMNATINGGGTIAVAADTWVTLATGEGSITAITSVSQASASGSISAIRVDDKILLDTALAYSVSAGGLNSTLYDQSQTWSDEMTSSTGFLGSYPVTAAFNGTFQGNGGAASGGSSGTTFTLTPPASMTVTSLEFNIYTDATLTLPDGSTQTIAGVTTNDTDVAADIGSGFSFTGSNSITLSNTSGHLFLERIKINGKELVDDTVSLTNVPSIASTYRVNNDAGFSIVSYEGTGANATVAHGLNAVPQMIMVKNREASESMPVYHVGVGNAKRMYLNVDAAASSGTNWNSTTPTSTVFSIGTNPDVSGNDQDIIAYCWSEVEGYSKFGSYTGNGSTNGAFVYCGFRPRWIMIKHSSGTYDWNIHDTERNPENDGNTAKLYPNLTAAELDDSEGQLDILSNGFKLKGNWNINNVAATYVFAAFAESPFKYANAR